MPPDKTSSALLLTGTVGAGKTTVAEAVGDLLRERAVPNAVVDLDRLRQAWPTPPGDRFHLDLMLRNLRDVAANFLAAGARRLVLAGVVESRSDRTRHEQALGVPLTVVRLRVDLGVVRARLARRHDEDPAGLRWHLDRSGELDAILATAAVEDHAVDATDAAVPDVARAVLQAAGWNH